MEFKNVIGLDLAQVKKDLSFSVGLESVVTEQDDRIGKNAVTRFTSEGKKILGLVSPKRNIIEYPEMIDWVTGEMSKLNVDFKLKESKLISKADNLFQQYLFDSPIHNPDGLDIAPMIILKASHVSIPLRLEIGTYRFVCANGALVGETIKSISVRANDLDGLLKNNLKDEISRGIDDMRKVSARYQELANEPMEAYMNELFQSLLVPLSLKKAMLEFWISDNTIAMTDVQKMKNADFISNDLVGPAVNSKSAWSLYNDVTDVVTHSSKNESNRNFMYNVISKVFAA